MAPQAYVGRFAPTPSGALHLGSLTAALASWLDARASGGRWWLRIEDIDPPREVGGAADGILRTLQAFGLTWDGEVIKQSTQQATYLERVFHLVKQGLAYACTCSRKQLEGFSVYPGTCRNAYHSLNKAAIRLRVPCETFGFIDRVQGAFSQQLADEVGDFAIWRKDGWPAYQLAVVLDDIAQGVTDVVRGADLLDSTPRQLYLYQLFGEKPPRYLHVPLLVQADGRKLSKSFRSTALADGSPGLALVRALKALGQCPPQGLQQEAVSLILDWAIKHWRIDKIPAVQTLAESTLV